jgi:hypothetical protein
LESYVFGEKQIVKIDQFLVWFRICSLCHHCTSVTLLSNTFNCIRFFRCTISKKYFLISFNWHRFCGNSCIFYEFLWVSSSKKAKIYIPVEPLTHADHHCR